MQYLKGQLVVVDEKAFQTYCDYFRGKGREYEEILADLKEAIVPGKTYKVLSSSRGLWGGSGFAQDSYSIKITDHWLWDTVPSIILVPATVLTKEKIN